MLYYQFNGYEGFKEIFGIQEHGNGVKSRRNKILLALLTSREFVNAVRTTAWNKGQRTVRAFMERFYTLKSMADMRQLVLDAMHTEVYPLGNYDGYTTDCYLLYDKEQRGCLYRLKSMQYEVMDGGLCFDGDFKAVRYRNRENDKIYKMKAGKFMRRLIDENPFGAILPEQVKVWMCEDFTERWIAYARGKCTGFHLHVGGELEDFETIYDDDIIFAYSPKSKAQQGLGADDKNGLWIALELLAERDVLKCAFFVGEEVGCVGSRQADMDFFKDVLYCIEPDRRNGGDLITEISGPICSQDFVDALGYEQFGYEPTDGLMTDVETLCENGVGVSCINISCGYYNPHTDQECTVWSELKNALDFARHICATLIDRYPHEYTDAWSAWDDGWYGFGRRRKRKASSYTAFDEDMDYETMDSILRYETHLTFEEVAKDYAGHFVTQDVDVLRCIYDDVKAYCVKDAQEELPQLNFQGEA